MRKTILLVLAWLAIGGTWSRAEESVTTAWKASLEAEAQTDYAAALKPLTALGNGTATNYYLQVRLGWLHYNAKNYTESIAAYGKASRLMPFAIEPLLGLLLAQQAAGKTDDALRTAQVALHEDPNNYTALSHTAWLLYLKHDYRAAATTYRKLVALYPTDTEMLLGLGYALKFTGDTKEAAQCFRTVLFLNPSNDRAKEALTPVQPNSEVRHGPPGAARRQ